MSQFGSDELAFDVGVIMRYALRHRVFSTKYPNYVIYLFLTKENLKTSKI